MSDNFQNNEVVNTTPVSGDTAAPENENIGTQGDEETTPRTFTQEELDSKVGERLAKERRKWERDQQTRAVEQQRQAPTTPPQPTQFTSVEAYNEAFINHRAEEIANQRENQKRQIETNTAYEDREEEAMVKYSDYRSVVHLDPKDGGPAISTHMAEVIKGSEIGPEIAYHLSKNRNESIRIYDLPPLQQAREIGKIEAKLIANPTPVKKVSSAPAPIKPLESNSSSASYSTSDPRSTKSLSTSEWIEQRNKELSKKQR